MKRRSFDEFDQIRLNLQWFDTLTNNTPLIERLFTSAPILPFTIAFGLGIVLAYQMQSARIVWVAAGCSVLSVGLCLLMALKAKTGFRLALALTGACLAMFALGIVRSC